MSGVRSIFALADINAMVTVCDVDQAAAAHFRNGQLLIMAARSSPGVTKLRRLDRLRFRLRLTRGSRDRPT